MESLKAMDDTLYYIADSIDEALAYLDDITSTWRREEEIDYVAIDGCRRELKDALLSAYKLSRSFKDLSEGEELGR